MLKISLKQNFAENILLKIHKLTDFNSMFHFYTPLKTSEKQVFWQFQGV